MDILTPEQATAEFERLSFFDSERQAARDALVSAMRKAKATAATFTQAELDEFGLTREGHKYVVKGSKSGPIRSARTDPETGKVTILLNPQAK